MSVHTIGRCSKCGGPVDVPHAWYGIYPPTPTCRNCGATAKPRGPVIPMESGPDWQSA